MSEQTLFYTILKNNLSEKELIWLDETVDKIKKFNTTKYFYISYSSIGRNISSKSISIEDDFFRELNFNLPVIFDSKDLVRYYILSLMENDKSNYVTIINNLFDSADEGEYCSLIKGFILLKYKEEFAFRFEEAIRTNLVTVFKAAAIDNPYPSKYLNENIWNQMVIKCFFVDVDINRIINLKTRLNPKLSQIAQDLKKERKAANRYLDDNIDLLILSEK
jgi:hypothetical protein